MDTNCDRTEVRMEYLKPRELDTEKARCATIFLPIGTIEWHGLQNVVGVDALKAHMLCQRAALRGGGIVHPPHYGAIGGLDEPYTFVFDPEDDVHSAYTIPWIAKWCREAQRNGYRALILLTGHYGPSQQMQIRNCAVEMSLKLGIPILGIPEYFLALDHQYYGDHGATFETSMMMDLYPDYVDLSCLEHAPHKGVYGDDPKIHANAAYGSKLNEVIVQRLALLSLDMPNWNTEERNSFIRAEQSLVRKQLTLASEFQNLWGGWRHIRNGVFDQYAPLLIQRKFAEIETLIEAL